jgi:SanA protein
MLKPKAGKKYWIAFTLIVLMILAVGAINLHILHSARGRIFSQISDVPDEDTALVMGTDMLRFNGSTNLHFFLRSEGAALLYQSGKAKKIANHRKSR